MPDTDLSRDDLGRLVRDVWLRWASSQPDITLDRVAYDDMSEDDKELGRLMGDAVASRFEDEVAELRGERDVLRAQADAFQAMCRRTCEELRRSQAERAIRERDVTIAGLEAKVKQLNLRVDILKRDRSLNHPFVNPFTMDGEPEPFDEHGFYAACR